MTKLLKELIEIRDNEKISITNDGNGILKMRMDRTLDRIVTSRDQYLTVRELERAIDPEMVVLFHLERLKDEVRGL